jgi:hypothetical protein
MFKFVLRYLGERRAIYKDRDTGEDTVSGGNGSLSPALYAKEMDKETEKSEIEDNPQSKSRSGTVRSE